MDYVGTIQYTLKVNFRMLKVWTFDVKWFSVICKCAHATLEKDPSGFFAIDSTKFWGDKNCYICSTPAF